MPSFFINQKTHSKQSTDFAEHLMTDSFIFGRSLHRYIILHRSLEIAQDVQIKSKLLWSTVALRHNKGTFSEQKLRNSPMRPKVSR